MTAPTRRVAPQTQGGRKRMPHELVNRLPNGEPYPAARYRWEVAMRAMYGYVPTRQEQAAAYEAVCASIGDPPPLTLTRDPRGRWWAR